jgi:Zn-dependent M16 (insulinase) family peptidase
MLKRGIRFISVLFLLSFMAVSVTADEFLEALKPDQKIHGFTVLNVYDNAQDNAMGARFISTKYGYLLDVMRIQSVPQAFMWVKTMPTTSMGRPHACEHLLLGKGNLGRYVAAQEDMMLSNSSAFTGGIKTCYHFNTVAGADAFYEIYEAKLNALLNPDFTDEEIQREVCHIGVNEIPETGELIIDERGTVYTEMVSAFENPWYYYGAVMNRLVFGEGHPLSNSAGGDPDIMREMTPEDMWKFIEENYHLANMGAIVSIPDEVDFESFLKNMNQILEVCQDFEDHSDNAGLIKYDFPRQDPAPAGTIKITGYPSDKESDFGHMIFAWPSKYDFGYDEQFMFEMFWNALCNGSTSNMYKLFINSESREIDLGAQYVFGGLDTDQGVSPYFGIGNTDNRHIKEIMLDSVGAMFVNEIRRVHDFADSSEELFEFNREVESRIIEQKKQLENYLNSPPMFGFRSGAGAGWMSLLTELEKAEGFRKSLVLKEKVAEAEKLIGSGENIWRDYIDRLGILEVTPYAVGTTPDPQMIAASVAAKEGRIRQHVDNFKAKYGVEDDQTAIAKYKEEFDAKTAELEAIAANQTLPEFIENPPLTLDEQLQYETIDLFKGVPLFAATFENMMSATMNLYLKLNVIPESLLVYLPLIPAILTDIGVYDNGQPVNHEEMSERLRTEILNLNAYYDNSFDNKRIELVITSQGGNLEEMYNAVGWMDKALYSSYLSVDNLPRINDVINQSLTSLRNRTKSPEEYWVSDPANAYRFQDNPLYLATNSFLTQSHYMSRLKWQFIDPGDETTLNDLLTALDSLAGIEDAGNRELLTSILTEIQKADEEEGSDEGLFFVSFGNQCKSLLCEIANELKQKLADIPDANLADDWRYLCAQIKQDLKVKPDEAIAGINAVLDHIRKADLARMVMISNSTDRNLLMGEINNFVNKLDDKVQSILQDYGASEHVINRLKSRVPELNQPVYVGLVHEGTQNGVLIFNAKMADNYDTTTASVLNCLAGKAYGGGGPHGFFMNTWGAGLAYSNGYNYGQQSGRCSYYAERCPDIAETMRFVVNLIKEAEDNPELADYAVAQVFGNSRAQSRYEARGIAMASNYQDGLPPEKVRAFRQKILDIKRDKELYNKIKEHYEDAYGPVFVGYGRSSAESEDGIFFIIGPPAQFESMEKYIESTESKQTIYRLYPRDFWLTT